MEIQLFKHNQLAYDASLRLLAQTGKAAVIHPTGTGKSFIAFQLCNDHPTARICWLSPSEYIFQTQLENWQRAGGDVLKNLQFFTYAKLMAMDAASLQAIQPDYIIFDEFHRCGAQMWGQGVARLLEQYPHIPMLGLSATNIRYLDNQRDMADELFDGNIASQMSLGEAIVRGILNPPKYVLSVFSYQKELERWERRVQKARNKAVREEAKRYLEALRRALEKADGLEDVFYKHMTEPQGKYIVFCANVEHLYEMRDMASQWFQKVDPDPHLYTMYADDPTTSKAFADFKADDSDHLKLLFCVDMLNEGIHVEDVSGVILLRPTISPIIYKQQIGRALSVKKRDAVIFDIVLNIENLYSIGEVEEEMQIAMAYYRSHGTGQEIVNEHFQVIDEVRDCIALFDRLHETLSASWNTMYEEAKKYYNTYGNLEVSKRYITEDGLRLGSWIDTQRRVYAGKINGVLTDEQIEKLNEIGMRFESSRDLQWKTHYEAAKAYYEAHGDLLVPVNEDDYCGIKLGRWIGQMRTYRKNQMQSKFLTDERIAALDAIGMVWDVPDYLWEQNYQAAKRYYSEHGNLDVPTYYVDEEGIRLGTWIGNLRAMKLEKGNAKRGKLTEEQIAKLDAIGMVWESRMDAKWNSAYEVACHYKAEYGNLQVPVAYVTSDGCKLGRWIRNQREAYKTGMRADRVEKLNAIGMVWQLPDAWEEKFQLVQDYYTQYGDVNMPVDYVVDGIWLSRWFREQVARMNGKGERTPLTEEQIAKLESIGIQQNVSKIDLAWENQYEEAKAFYLQNGHLFVAKDYKTSNGKNLNLWLSKQRDKKKKGTLTQQRCEKLDAIGMQWEKQKERVMV